MRRLDPRRIKVTNLTSGVADALARHKLIVRIIWARQLLRPVWSDLRILFEDGDGPVKILIPDPHFMAAALFGGILPPVEAFGGPQVDTARPIGPITESETVEYLLRKDVPRHVWDLAFGANRLPYRICGADALPPRQWAAGRFPFPIRDAWRLAA